MSARSALFRYIRLRYVRKLVIAILACLTTFFLVLGLISATTGIPFKISALQLWSSVQPRDLASVNIWSTAIAIELTVPMPNVTVNPTSRRSRKYDFVLEGWVNMLWYHNVYNTPDSSPAPTYVPAVKRVGLFTIRITFLRWWVVPAVTGIWPLWVAIARVHAWLRRRHRGRLGLCLKCGYPRQGLPGPQCPECGSPAPAAAEITEQAAVAG